jgi:DNA (cytosine-5)-methyltransferase 1
MLKVGKDEFEFSADAVRKGKVRRLTVREAAEVQTFPSDFKFVYSNVVNGYKMVGNAVPVKFAEHLGQAIYNYLKAVPAADLISKGKIKPGRAPKRI